MTAAQPSKKNPEFLIQRIYVKDISFESPGAPAVFKENLQPLINVNVQIHLRSLEETVHEVTLEAAISAKVETRPIFLIEAQQAGIFTLQHIPAENMGAVLNVSCPTILFPYLRELVSDLSARGGFSNFYLAPINFEALYMDKLAQQKNK